MLEKPEGTTKNGKSRDTGKIEHTRRSHAVDLRQNLFYLRYWRSLVTCGSSHSDH